MPGIINKEKLVAVNRMVHALYRESLDEFGEGKLVTELGMRVTSNDTQETHNWLNNFMELREWIGPRQFATLKGEGLTIYNKPYEVSIALKRRDILADRLGMLNVQVRQLTEAYYRGRRKIVANLVTQGHTTTGLGKAGYDGVAFFSNAHPNEDLPNQSNVGTGAALNATSFDAAKLQMRELVNHKGEPLDINPNLLVIGPKNEAAAKSLFGLRTVSTGGDNPHFGDIDNIIVEPRITDTSWNLFDTTHVVKPIIDQMFVPLELSSQTDLSDDRVFNYNEYAWGLYSDFGFGYGFWQTGYRNPGV